MENNEMEAQEAAPKEAIKPKEAKKQSGFEKNADPKLSKFDGVNLWTATFDQWFAILGGLAGNKMQHANGKQKAEINGVNLWRSEWDAKYKLLQEMA